MYRVCKMWNEFQLSSEFLKLKVLRLLWCILRMAAKIETVKVIGSVWLTKKIYGPISMLQTKYAWYKNSQWTELFYSNGKVKTHSNSEWNCTVLNTRIMLLNTCNPVHMPRRGYWSPNSYAIYNDDWLWITQQAGKKLAVGKTLCHVIAYGYEWAPNMKHKWYTFWSSSESQTCILACNLANLFSCPIIIDTQ